MRTVINGRRIWALSGLATLALLSVPGIRIITGDNSSNQWSGPTRAVPSRTLTITRPVTSLTVESYGAPVVVTTGPVQDIQVTESIMYGPPMDGPPTVSHKVSGGRLVLAAPACQNLNCSVGFTLIVPRDVAVTATSDGGPISVSGVAAANVDSGGGNVQAGNVTGSLTINAEGGSVVVSRVGAANVNSGGGDILATDVSGPLTLSSEGGNLTVNGLTGPLNADTGGGTMTGSGIAAVTATVDAEGGNVQLVFTTAPQAVSVDTGSGNAQLYFAAPPKDVTVGTEGGDASVAVPGGPYAVTTTTEGGSQTIGIATSPAAHRSITVDSGGGSLEIVPAGPVPVLPALPADPGMGQ